MAEEINQLFKYIVYMIDQIILLTVRIIIVQKIHSSISLELNERIVEGESEFLFVPYSVFTVLSIAYLWVDVVVMIWRFSNTRQDLGVQNVIGI